MGFGFEHARPRGDQVGASLRTTLDQTLSSIEVVLGVIERCLRLSDVGAGAFFRGDRCPEIRFGLLQRLSSLVEIRLGLPHCRLLLARVELGEKLSLLNDVALPDGNGIDSASNQGRHGSDRGVRETGVRYWTARRAT